MQKRNYSPIFLAYEKGKLPSLRALAKQSSSMLLSGMGLDCLANARNDGCVVTKKQFYARLLLPFLVLLLSGCIPVIVAAVAATAGGAIIYDKRPSEVILQDQDISNKALSALNSDPELKGAARVSVATFNHVVLMVGQTESEELRDRAYRDVRQVPNVKRVYNQIQISPILTTWDQSEDAWVTSKVKTAMLAKRGLSSSQIKVVTENKVVYLMGLVTPNQAKLATDAARNVAGVKKVVQVFEYET